MAWFAGGTFQFAQSFNGGPVERSSGTYAVQGNQLTLRRTCPLPELLSPFDSFDANERELTFYATSMQRALVYRRR